ncbi:hypothetical protein THERMOS_1848 [Bathymodiolus thermophilus thioautotrophic gill symbiont]|uniref:Uncharacterized protein n=1 Tax=Bathymodiolus thermophilus thioautotrophic gill symbiont TaxID=2360 RepID=A0A8H8XFI3_9GAMM|nr:hypothetical protein THERMOS_1848 [Bathymodiolus thermophilus thioautotrophic gill symbiont]
MCFYFTFFIHRHTGGLENAIYKVFNPVCYSPPHRRLRKVKTAIVGGILYSPPHRRLRKSQLIF